MNKLVLEQNEVILNCFPYTESLEMVQIGNLKTGCQRIIYTESGSVYEYELNR